jgi:flagellar biogenesis protein FliO
MELIETLQLGGKRQLMLVVCDGRRILVGAGGDGVQAVVEMQAAPEEVVKSPECGTVSVTQDRDQELRCC